MVQAVTPEGRYAYVNQAWLKALGYAAGDVPGLSMMDVIHPDCRAHCLELFRRLLAGERLGLAEATFVGKDGRQIEVEGSVSTRLADGQVQHTQGIFRDVSERNRIAAEVKSANERLLEANRQLRESNRQRQELFDLAVMHDFGTPLTVIQSYVDLLAEGLLGA